jgi:hypothetical protein
VAKSLHGLRFFSGAPSTPRTKGRFTDHLRLHALDQKQTFASGYHMTNARPETMSLLSAFTPLPGAKPRTKLIVKLPCRRLCRLAKP